VAEELANSDTAGAIELLEASRKAFKSDTRDLFDWYLSLLRRFAKLAPSESTAVFREFVTSINRSGQPENTADATAYEAYVPVELPTALVEPDVVGILQATSEVKPSSIRVRTRLSLLKTFYSLVESRVSKEAVPPQKLYSMVIPSHVLIDKNGVIVRKWPGTSNSEVRYWMANEIIAETRSELSSRE
jgi:hypothetical protein